MFKFVETSKNSFLQGGHVVYAVLTSWRIPNMPELPIRQISNWRKSELFTPILNPENLNPPYSFIPDAHLKKEKQRLGKLKPDTYTLSNYPFPVLKTFTLLFRKTNSFTSTKCVHAYLSKYLALCKYAWSL
jgi:hypothetical protein